MASSKLAKNTPATLGLALQDEVNTKQAETWITRYREANSNGTWSQFVGKTVILDLFAITDAKGIRFHKGIDATAEEHMMLVAVNSNGHDIYPGSNSTSRTSGDIEGMVVSDPTRCPPDCPMNAAPIKCPPDCP